ncbi:extracellular solute-binding protein [Halobacterium wangiae]|uniref:extracellular solute-binding protein n=1 Tax=Halobacterium wangiae TaxID=2902623 RepID=UPI001E423E75|nr:extracellular solute-binding protein [Halobacterium wangiae]
MSDGFGRTRRRFLAATGAVTASGLAGCTGLLGGNGGGEKPALADFRGSGPLVSDRPAPGGTSIEDLPDLEGELNVYLGGGEGGRYENLLELFNRYYDGFEATWSVQPSSQLAKQIEQENANDTVRAADVFWSVDAGSLAYVADVGATTQLSSEARSPVPDAFKTDQWVGVAGRARAIPYNTEQFAESDVPDDVATFATDDRFSGAMGWAPTYGAFHSFVTAMRLQRGEETTRQWLEDMVTQGVARYDNEFLVSESVANGEIGAGFANHYYAIRVLARRDDAPIELAFTKNDAGALVNVSGASVLGGSDRQDLADLFVRHLLSAEAQEFIATRGFAYPMISEVEPVGPLPTIDELEPPEIDLQELSNVQPTLEMLRDVGILS